MLLRAFRALLAIAVAGVVILRAESPDTGVAGTMPEDYLPGLRHYLDAVLQQSPEMIKNALEIDIADAQKLSNGIAPLLPRMNANISYGENWSAVSSNLAGATTNKGFFYDLNVSQPVFKWGQLRDQLLIQKINVALTQRQYADAYQQLVNSLRGQYMALITDKMTVRNMQYLHQEAARFLDYVRGQIKAGTASAGAVAGAELAEARSSLDAQQAEESYAFARRQFAREVGLKDIGDADIPDELPAPRYSEAAAQTLLADLLRTGARYTPQAQSLLMSIRQASLNYKFQKVSQLPMLSLSADLNKQNQVNASNNSVSATSVTNERYAVSADWDIFDGLATRGRKEEALARRRELERELKITAEGLMDQGQNQERTVAFAWEAQQIASRAYDLDKSGVEVAESDLKRGVGSEQAVASARAGANASQLALMNSRSHFLSVWAEFVTQVGHDPAMDHVPSRYVRLIP